MKQTAQSIAVYTREDLPRRKMEYLHHQRITSVDVNAQISIQTQ